MRSRNKMQWYTIIISVNQYQSQKDIIHNRELVIGALKSYDYKAVFNLTTCSKAFTIKTILTKKIIEEVEGVDQILEGCCAKEVSQL
jgi:hypothetical protein